MTAGFVRASRRHGFTLMELLLVIGIIGIVAVLLLPALGPQSGRALDGAAHQFAADVENARLIAIAERTRTRVLVPDNSGNFTGGASSSVYPSDIARRGYLITRQNKTGSTWAQRGKWTRFPQGVAVSTFTQPNPSPTPGMAVDVAGTGTATYTFNGPYIEFLANGSCSLDPTASPTPAVVVADGFVDSSQLFKAKNANLKSTVTIDPLSGSVSVK